mgnify:CR=1 FL=1
MLWFLLISSLLIFPLCLKAWVALSLLSSFLMQNFTNQDSNCVCDDNFVTQEMIWYQYGMVCMLWEVWSLMCTSNVAGNTQMASLDRQVTQNGLGVNNAMARGIYNGVVEVTVLCDDEWRCSWCRYQDDGDSSLSSRNTLGNGKKPRTQNLKWQMSNGGSGKRRWCCTMQCGSGMMGYTRRRSW